MINTMTQIQEIVEKAEKKIQEIAEKERQGLIKHMSVDDDRMSVTWVALSISKVKDEAIEEILELIGVSINDEYSLSWTQEEVDNYRIEHNMTKYGTRWH